MKKAELELKLQAAQREAAEAKAQNQRLQEEMKL